MKTTLFLGCGRRAQAKRIPCKSLPKFLTSFCTRKTNTYNHSTCSISTQFRYPRSLKKRKISHSGIASFNYNNQIVVDLLFLFLSEPKLAEMRLEERKASQFKAQPAKVLNKEPFKVKLDHSQNNHTDVVEFSLTTVKRAAERKNFDQFLKEREQEKEMHKLRVIIKISYKNNI